MRVPAVGVVRAHVMIHVMADAKAVVNLNYL